MTKRAEQAATEPAQEEFDRAELDRMQGEALDQLSFAMQRHKQLLPFHAIGKVSDEEIAEAEQSVRRAEQKVEGLGYWFEKADARDKEQEEAAKAARRRQTAVEILSLVHQRYWATVQLDKAIAAVGAALVPIDLLRRQIIAEANLWFGDDNRGQDALRNFLMGIGALDLTDTTTRFNADVGRLNAYSTGLPFSRKSALNALATVLPEVQDPAVEQEAIEAAKRAAGEEPKD